MITSFKIFEKEDIIFHCYVPYFDKELFIIALSKISIDESLRRKIVEFMDNDKMFSDRYAGFFLRFFNNEWDFYEVKATDWMDIEEISEKLKDATFNEDGLVSTLPEGESIYIGEIRLTKQDIDFYKEMQKFNV